MSPETALAFLKQRYGLTTDSERTQPQEPEKEDQTMQPPFKKQRTGHHSTTMSDHQTSKSGSEADRKNRSTGNNKSTSMLPSSSQTQQGSHHHRDARSSARMETRPEPTIKTEPDEVQENQMPQQPVQASSKHSQQLRGLFDQVKQKAEAMEEELKVREELCHDLQSRLNDQERLAAKLHVQVLEFKNIIASTSGAPEQASDDDIRVKYEDIFKRLRNFVLGNFRKAKFSYRSLPQHVRSEITEFIPAASYLRPESNIYILMSIVADEIADLFEAWNHFGDTHHGPVFHASAVGEEIARLGNQDSKEWLASTRKLLLASHAKDMNAAEKSLIHRTVRSVIETLDDARVALPAEWSIEQKQELANIFVSARKLSELLFSQQAKFEIKMLKAEQSGGKKMSFTSKGMEEVCGDSDVNGKPVAISVFPGLYKYSNETSEQGERMTLVAPLVRVVDYGPRSTSPARPARRQDPTQTGPNLQNPQGWSWWSR